MKPHILFICNKCNHQLFIKTEHPLEKVIKILKKPCPNCEEMGDENFNGIWTFVREGNYEKEFGIKSK